MDDYLRLMYVIYIASKAITGLYSEAVIISVIVAEPRLCLADDRRQLGSWLTVETADNQWLLSVLKVRADGIDEYTLPSAVQICFIYYV